MERTPSPAFSRRHVIVSGAAAAIGSCARAPARTAPGIAAGAEGLVRRENQKAGTTDWLLTNVEPAQKLDVDERYHRRRAVEGFASHTSVRAGDALTVFVSADPPSPVRVDVFRMGYYGGAGARRVTTLGPLSARVQGAAVETDQRLVTAPWEPSFELRIPGDWLSGVYLGKLTSLETGYEGYFVFVVRDDRRADYLFQVSDMTWQAYNRWPAWRSIYDWGTNRWHVQPGADVGFQRPYGIYYNTLPSALNTLTNGSGEFLLWEHPLCFWLEQQGYDVTYISNLDTHTDPAGLRRACGFLSVGHDEYWTREMFDNVARARDAGLNLAFLSGNSVYWQVGLEPGKDGRPNGHFGRIAQFDDEHQLLGGSSYGVGLGDFVCAEPGHWIYKGSGMKAGERIAQLVGWEYHGLPLRPNEGLEIVARAPVRNAAESEPGEHVATVYYGSRGNFVFDAGTCWWNMLLSSPPGFVSPPGRDLRGADARVQRITANVLDRMRA